MARLKTPKRIQRKRTKGWRMPPNTVYVGRPTKWGNPFKVGVCGTVENCFDAFRITAPYFDVTDDIEELRGKNLACWCKLGEPCHADVLLELANE